LLTLPALEMLVVEAELELLQEGSTLVNIFWMLSGSVFLLALFTLVNAAAA
jgi:hypothetical protein